MTYHTKVIVRHLPATLTEEQFRDTFDPLPPHNYLRFCSADKSLEHLAFSRAYVNFNEAKFVDEFYDKFSRITFEDGSSPLIEFAPYQEIPKVGIKRDKRENTLETDEVYRAFLDSLNEDASETGRITWESVLKEIIEKEKQRSEIKIETPLLKYFEEQFQRRLLEKNLRDRNTRGKRSKKDFKSESDYNQRKPRKTKTRNRPSNKDNEASAPTATSSSKTSANANSSRRTNNKPKNVKPQGPGKSGEEHEPQSGRGTGSGRHGSSNTGYNKTRRYQGNRNNPDDRDTKPEVSKSTTKTNEKG